MQGSGELNCLLIILSTQYHHQCIFLLFLLFIIIIVSFFKEGIKVAVNAIVVATATTALEKISVVGTKINKYGI